MNLTTLGVWAALDPLTAADTAAFAKRVEAWCYGTPWIPQAVTPRQSYDKNRRQKT